MSVQLGLPDVRCQYCDEGVVEWSDSSVVFGVMFCNETHHYPYYSTTRRLCIHTWDSAEKSALAKTTGLMFHCAYRYILLAYLYITKNNMLRNFRLLMYVRKVFLFARYPLH